MRNILIISYSKFVTKLALEISNLRFVKYVSRQFFAGF